MATLTPSPKMQFFDNNGDPLVGGKLYTYLSGTTTPTFTKTTSTGNVNNTNPIILDARGEASIWLDESIAYRFVLKTSTDVELWTSDGVRGSLVSTLRGRQLFVANGSFTVPIGVSTIWISGVAGGGSGGGAGSNNVANQVASPGGGGGSGQAAFRYSQAVTPGEVIAITIGLGGLTDATHGTGGTAGLDNATNGNNGTNTVIGTYLTLDAGLAGGAGGISTAAINAGPTNAVGGPGGSLTIGTGIINGQNGQWGSPRGPNGGHVVSSFGGDGGSNPFGMGGRGARIFLGAGLGNDGEAGYGYGSGGGGGGAAFDNPSTGGNGGNGADGMVLIEW